MRQSDSWAWMGDESEMMVESVSERGDVVVRFFGGAALVFAVAPELARFYRRLVPTRGAGLRIGGHDERRFDMLVKDLMSTDPVTVSPDHTLEEAAGAMWDHDIGALPVVAGGQQALGMITDRDICMGAYTQGKGLHDIRVGEVMSTAVLGCLATDTVAHAEQIMQRGQVRRLPVADEEGRLVGMVSLNDIARASRQRARDGVRADEVAATLAAIGVPRTTLH